MLISDRSVYLTFWYTKTELALRVGYLFVSAAIAGALGGLLAFGIGHLDGHGELYGSVMHGWRWIMIIEGIPTFLLGIATYFLLPNEPDGAYFLNDQEKAFMRTRWAKEYGMTSSAQEFDKKDVKKAFKDWKVWLFCAGQFGADNVLYGW
jgi:sugar phosphate permease